MNPYGKDLEPASLASTTREAITLGDFQKMIESTWPSGSNLEDVDAYVNRAHIIVPTYTWIYYRFRALATRGYGPSHAMASP